MPARKAEVLVGATVLAALAILIGGVTWLKDLQLARSYRVWHVTFPETGGLSKSDEVRVNGLRKGEVRSMDLAGDHVAVDLALVSEVQLTTDCRVAVRNIGLMGEKVIAVDLVRTGRPYDAKRDTIPGVFERGIPEVMGEMGEAIGSVQSLATELHTVADALNRNGALQASIRNFHQTSEELRLVVQENRAALRSTVEDFAVASRATRRLTAGREEELRRAMDDFISSASRMNQLTARLDSLRGQIASVVGKVDRGDGTLGRLLNDDRLYKELHQAIGEFRDLVADVKAHPKKYLKIGLF